MVIAEQVMGELGLSRVLFVPGGIPPHKEASSVRASAEDRFYMVEAAVAENERFSVDRVEVDAGRPMHSVETVGILKERLDRKSTRLNSSHANISYAVFCLKKKY